MRNLYISIVIFAWAAPVFAQVLPNAKAAQEHTHCAAFYMLAAVGPGSESNQNRIRQKATLHAQNAVTLSDRPTFDRYSGESLEKINAELKGSQAQINALIQKTTKYCDEITARDSNLLTRRAEEPKAAPLGTRR